LQNQLKRRKEQRRTALEDANENSASAEEEVERLKTNLLAHMHRPQLSATEMMEVRGTVPPRVHVVV